jgi:hypothetical protein
VIPAGLCRLMGNLSKYRAAKHLHRKPCTEAQ